MIPEQVVRQQERPHIRTGTLDDEAAIATEDMMELLLADTHVSVSPNTRLSHALNKVATRQQHDFDASASVIC